MYIVSHGLHKQLLFLGGIGPNRRRSPVEFSYVSLLFSNLFPAENFWRRFNVSSTRCSPSPSPSSSPPPVQHLRTPIFRPPLRFGADSKNLYGIKYECKRESRPNHPRINFNFNFNRACKESQRGCGPSIVRVHRFL